MNGDEQGALKDPRPMPGNHGSPHQSFCKAVAAASVPQVIADGWEFCLRSWRSFRGSSGSGLQAYVIRTCQVGNVGHFHDTHPGIAVFINSNLQGQHLLIEDRSPSPASSSLYKGAYSPAGRKDGGRYRSPGTE